MAGFSALLLHFGFVFIYCNPLSTEKNRAYYYSYYYTYPFFSQSWTLFTPAPNCNYHLFAEFEKNGIQKTEVLSDLLYKHQSNRLAGYEPTLLCMANTIHYFEKASPLQKALNGPVSDDKNFDLLVYSTRRYLENQYNTKIDKLKLILVVQPINGQPQRIYFGGDY